MTDAEKITNYHTQVHIRNVALLLNRVASELLKRGETHDHSKLIEPELSTFTEFTPKLKLAEYGSEEYKQFLIDMKPALDHHYAEHRHHPEHFPNGIEGMTLVDLIEMLCDWKAATLRTKDGNLLRSIELNKDRYKINDQLISILRNTAFEFETVDGLFDEDCNIINKDI